MQFSPISLLLYGAALVLLLFCSAIYYYRGRQNENRNQKIVMIGFACLIFCVSVGQILNLFLFFQLEGDYMNHVFYSEGKIVTLNQTTETLYIIQMLAYLLGIALFILSFEMSYNRTKYKFTIINIILITLSLIFWILKYSALHFDPFKGLFFRNFYEIAVVYNIVFLMGILFYFTKWSDLAFKNLASLIQFGFLLICLGLVLSGGEIKYYNIIPVEFSPVLLIVGAIFVYFPLIGNLEKSSNPLKIWRILGLITIIIAGTLTIFVIIHGTLAFNFNLPIYLFTSVLVIFFLILITYINHHTIRIIKQQIIQGDKKYKKDLNILEMFRRPLKISEEQISLSKEKRICLICKAKIQGQNYMCPDCDTLYCKKCYEASVNLENICWVCHRALDDSKPVQIYEPPSGVDQLQGGKIALPPKDNGSGPVITVFSPNFIEKLDTLEWDSQERTEFLKEMVLYPPEERVRFLDELIQNSLEIDQKLHKKKMGEGQ